MRISPILCSSKMHQSLIAGRPIEKIAGATEAVLFCASTPDKILGTLKPGNGLWRTAEFSGIIHGRKVQANGMEETLRSILHLTGQVSSAFLPLFPGYLAFLDPNGKPAVRIIESEDGTYQLRQFEPHLSERFMRLTSAMYRATLLSGHPQRILMP